MRQPDLVWHQRGDRSANLMVRLGFAFGSKQDEQKSANGTKSFGLMILFPYTFMSQINCQRGIHMSSSETSHQPRISQLGWYLKLIFCPCCFLLLFSAPFEPGEEYVVFATVIGKWHPNVIHIKNLIQTPHRYFPSDFFMIIKLFRRC